MLVVIAFNYVGDALRDSLEVQLRQRQRGPACPCAMPQSVGELPRVADRATGVWSGTWQAATWPSPKSCNSVSATGHRGCTAVRRVLNRQTIGANIDDGGSPPTRTRTRTRPRPTTRRPLPPPIHSVGGIRCVGHAIGGREPSAECSQGPLRRRGGHRPVPRPGDPSPGRSSGQTVISVWRRSLASMNSSTMEKTTSLALRTVVARPMTWPHGLKFTSLACSG